MKQGNRRIIKLELCWIASECPNIFNILKNRTLLGETRQILDYYVKNVTFFDFRIKMVHEKCQVLLTNSMLMHRKSFPILNTIMIKVCIFISCRIAASSPYPWQTEM